VTPYSKKAGELLTTMALSGNLRDFALPDVFRLVSLSGKTGVLRIHKADAEGSVWFRGGDVFFAQSDRRRQLLGQRLVTAGRVTSSALARAVAEREIEPEGGRRLGEILVDAGEIDFPVLEAFVQEQIQDTVFDLFAWDEGEFAFELLTAPPLEQDIGLSVSIENIVMEGARRVVEWTGVHGAPPASVVFRMASAPAEGTIDIELKPSEWRVLLLVDGTRTVGDIARDAQVAEVEVARTLRGLLDAGLIEIVEGDEAEPGAWSRSENACTAHGAPREAYAEAVPSHEELGLSNTGLWAGLGDELTALTGGHDRRRSKHSASSAPGADRPLHRDSTVPREVIEKTLRAIEAL
jgi:uncharacterized protein DUF4388